jgi:dihydrofolate reductase
MAMTKRLLTYSYIVARSKDHVIGCDNQLPWRLSTDLKRFKTLTLGKPIIMGRKTYESIGRPLPNRLNIVVTRDPNFSASGAVVVRSKIDATRVAEEAARSMNADEIFVIGGEGVFNLFNDIVSRIYLTEVHVEVGSVGDARFDWDISRWTARASEHVPRSALDEYDSDFFVYERPQQSKSLGRRRGEEAYAA